MTKFFLSTDSTADLFKDEIDKMGVGFLPLTLTIDEGSISFMEDSFTQYSQYVDFYNLLRRAVPVKTSMNNLDKHLEYFSRLAAQGHKNIIHFTISYGLAPTKDVAEQAIAQVKETYPDINIIVVESHTTTVGQGVLVKAAYKMQQEGKSLEETAQYVNELKHRIQHFIVVDDLYHLKRGGRVSGAAAMVGTALQLKIILNFDKEGKLSVNKKVMGGLRKAIKTVVVESNKFTLDETPYLTVVHTDNVLAAQELAKALEEKYSVRPEIRIMGPTIGCHVGPGAVAFIFVSKEPRQ